MRVHAWWVMFSLRRQEIVKKEPAVQDIVERWPALFTEGESSDVTARRSVVLKGLPIVFGDDPNKFYKTCFETTKDEAIDNVTVGVLTILSEDDPEQPVSTAIVLE